jgi:hypothetical protein
VAIGLPRAKQAGGKRIVVERVRAPVRHLQDSRNRTR